MRDPLERFPSPRVLLALVLLLIVGCRGCDQQPPPPPPAPASLDARGVVDPRRIAFNPAVADRLLVVDLGGVASVWNVADPQRPTKTWSAAAGARDGQFLPDGSRVITGGTDGSVRAWDGEGRLLWSSPPHAGPVRAVAVGTDRIASAGQDGIIGLWTFDGRSAGTLSGHEGMVLSVAFAPSGDWIASEGADTRLRLWRRQGDGTFSAGPVFRAASPRYQQMLPGLVSLDVQWGWDRSVVFLPPIPLLGATDFTGAAQLWNLDGSPHGAPFKAPDGNHLRQIAATADGSLLATGSQGGTVQLWNPDGTPHGAALSSHVNAVTSLAFDPRGGRLASASVDGSVLLWRVPEGTVLGALPRGR